MAHVFHFTDSTHLPWIVASGELRPSVAAEASNHFIWATTDPDYESTARSSKDPCMPEWLEHGHALTVRFTLTDTGFIQWNRSKSKRSWEAEYIAKKKKQGIKRAWARREHTQWFEQLGAHKWRIRREPIPLADVLRIDVRAYAGERWQRFRPTSKNCFEIPVGDDDPPAMCVNVDGFHYYSQMIDSDCYWAPDRDELNEMYENSL
jgi:hypothetical protein